MEKANISSLWCSLFVVLFNNTGFAYSEHGMVISRDVSLLNQNICIFNTI